MLTREEAIEFKKRLNISENMHVSTGAVDFVIDEFTEKPKIEIKVGDIYKDGTGKYNMVHFINSDRKLFYACSSLKGFDLNYMTAYYSDGKAYGNKHIEDYDLDLSKRYEITEVKDVN